MMRRSTKLSCSACLKKASHERGWFLKKMGPKRKKKYCPWVGAYGWALLQSIIKSHGPQCTVLVICVVRRRRLVIALLWLKGSNYGMRGAPTRHSRWHADRCPSGRDLQITSNGIIENVDVNSPLHYSSFEFIAWQTHKFCQSDVT